MLQQVESVLSELTRIIESRKGVNSETSYVARLLEKGENTLLKKVGEECTEVIIAAKSGQAHQIVYESADLLFHMMVMLSHYKLSIEDVIVELGRREGLSGLEEKASRNERPLPLLTTSP